jgi:hypothetical protein
MILLRDLKEAMPLHHGTDMSVHVPTCISYDFNASCVEVVALIRCVSMSHRKNE